MYDIIFRIRAHTLDILHWYYAKIDKRLLWIFAIQRLDDSR